MCSKTREGPDTGRPDPPRPRVAAPTQDGQRLLHAASRPLRDGLRESCPAAVNAQTASPSTNSSRCHRPSRDRGSGTSACQSRGQQRDSSVARAPASSSAGASIRDINIRSGSMVFLRAGPGVDGTLIWTASRDQRQRFYAPSPARLPSPSARVERPPRGKDEQPGRRPECRRSAGSGRRRLRGKSGHHRR
jgi:hypothetical protein